MNRRIPPKVGDTVKVTMPTNTPTEGRITEVLGELLNGGIPTVRKPTIYYRVKLSGVETRITLTENQFVVTDLA